MLKLFAILLLGVAFLAPGNSRIVAQQAPAQRFTMQRIVFKGSRNFADQQLLNAIGLKVGAAYTQQQLVDAGNALAGSGMFSQVSYRFTPSSAEYNLIDNPQLLPVRFENCVWMADEQVLARLKERLPFFVGQIPEEGGLADETQREVELMLADHGVKARLQYMPVGEGSERAISYRVIHPRIEVSAVHFTGASPRIAQALEEAGKSILGKEYTPTLLSSTQETKLKPILQENGYLQSRFGQSSWKLASAVGDPSAKIEFTVPVEEGAQYRIASLSMKGTDPVALDAAKRLATFKTGDVANMTAFRAELSRLGSAYLAKGHMSAKVRAEPKFDEVAHTVSFDVELVPGEVYRLSKLELEGLDETQQARLAPIWKLNPGDAYDATYAPTFMSRNSSKLGFLNGYGLAWTQKINDASKTVDLFVFFRKP